MTCRYGKDLKIVVMDLGRCHVDSTERAESTDNPGLYVHCELLPNQLKSAVCRARGAESSTSLRSWYR